MVAVSGTFPATKLSKLEYLSLIVLPATQVGTRLSGTIPVVSNVTLPLLKTWTMNLSVAVSGSLPSHLLGLPALSAFEFSTPCQVSGTIPQLDKDNFAANLSRLVFATYPVSGTLPGLFIEFEKLADFRSIGTKISGTLPDVIRFIPLRHFLVSGPGSGGRLSGSIPESYGNLTHMANFMVSGNRLSSSIPMALKTLEMVDVNNCSFSGSIAP